MLHAVLSYPYVIGAIHYSKCDPELSTIKHRLVLKPSLKIDVSGDSKEFPDLRAVSLASLLSGCRDTYTNITVDKNQVWSIELYAETF